jgi:Rieske 2Fe-2S family protein
MAHTACRVPVTQTRDGSNFRKTAATFEPGAKTLRQRYFVSPEIFAEELQKIFATNWVLVGHLRHLAEPGDYFLADVAGESLIVT